MQGGPGLRSRLRIGLRVGAMALLALVGLACSSSTEFTGVVRVLTHEDFHLPVKAIAEFEQNSGLRVVVSREADRMAVMNLLRRWGPNPAADVVIGVDTLDLTRVIDEGLVEPYAPLRPETIDPLLRVEDGWMTPVSYLDTCLNYAPSRYIQPERELSELPDPNVPQVPPVPRGLVDLANPVHASTAVLPNASTSRMGLYLLVALEHRFPEGTDQNEPWPKVLNQMLRSGVKLEPTWEQAYFARFLQDTTGPTDEIWSLTWGSTGLPAVYAQYHPNLSHLPIDELEVDVAVVRDDCVRVVNYAGVTAGTANRRAAGLFMDFIISPPFQYAIPDRFGSRPARVDILSTEEWRQFGVRVEPITIDPDYVGRNWEVWQLTWSQVVREAAAAGEPVPPVVTVTLPS